MSDVPWAAACISASESVLVMTEPEEEGALQVFAARRDENATSTIARQELVRTRGWRCTLCMTTRAQRVRDSPDDAEWPSASGQFVHSGPLAAADVFFLLCFSEHIPRRAACKVADAPRLKVAG